MPYSAVLTACSPHPEHRERPPQAFDGRQNHAAHEADKSMRVLRRVPVKEVAAHNGYPNLVPDEQDGPDARAAVGSRSNQREVGEKLLEGRSRSECHVQIPGFPIRHRPVGGR